MARLFHEMSGEDFAKTKTLRKVNTEIMSDVEDATAFVGFVGPDVGPGRIW